MKILGLDLGEKRTGVAISNEINNQCSSLNEINASNSEILVNKINIIIKENKIEKLIIGLPKLLNGTEGDRAIFSRLIAKKIKASNKELRIVLWDERLTTEQAFKSMKSTGMKIKNIKSKLNSVSAIIILESYLQNENTK